MAAEFDSQILLPRGSSTDVTSDVIRNLIKSQAGSFEFSITLGDLTEVDVDAIVCPANPGFEPAYTLGGVQGGIARRAGTDIFDEAERKAKQYIASGGLIDRSTGYDALPLGYALSTSPGKLSRIKSIIHVNNMRSERGLPACDESVVRLCAASVLAEADTKREIDSVAFPAIGTGLWGMTLAESLRGTLLGVRDYHNMTPSTHVNRILFVVYAQPSYANALEMQNILRQEVFPQLT